VEPSLRANAAVDAVYRSDWGRIVATLIRLVGDFDVAEEASQEAFAAAVDQWTSSGVPEFPRAWIIQTARHKAIDRIRRRARLEEKLDAYAATESTRAVDEPDYVRRAVRLGTDPVWREQVRSKILAANGVLYENPAVLPELEQFFVEAVGKARNLTTDGTDNTDENRQFM